MIDALFGSKTRVKLLHLFLNNPGQPFYVREITRKIEEQINSVRRELANMLNVGIITSDSSNNKLYYQVNQRYEYYIPLRAIFSDVKSEINNVSLIIKDDIVQKYKIVLDEITGLRLAIFAGVLVKKSNSSVDMVLVGNISSTKVKTFISLVEKNEGRDINYTILPYDEFYYRLSVKDKFVNDILNNKYVVAVDKDNILNKGE